MYYKNRKTFYIVQYGPKIFLTVALIAGMLCGSFYYLKKNNINDKTLMKAFNDKITKDTILTKGNDDVVEEHASASLLDSDFAKSFGKEKVTLDTEFSNKDFEKLETGELSGNFKVKAVNDINNIVIEDKKQNTYTICMIGVKSTASLTNSNTDLEKYKAELNALLKNNEVQVKFDSIKSENNLYFAYVYYNGKMLNTSIIKYGYSKMKVEKSNILILKELTDATVSAKKDNLGVWKIK